MESYRPAEIPIFKKMITHPGTQFFLLLLCLVGALQFFYSRDRSDVNGRISFLKGPVQISSAEQSSLSFDSQTATSDSDVSSNEEIKPETQEVRDPDLEVAAAVEKKQSPATEPISDKQLTVTYYEVPRAGLLKIFEESQAEGHFADFKDYSTGLIENFSQKKSTFQLKELSTQKVILNQNTGSLFTGIKDTSVINLVIGFQSYFYFQRVSPNLARLNVEIIRSWREASEPGRYAIQTKEFPVQFEISNKTVLFMSGIMPKQSNLFEQEDTLASIPAFKILNSNDFQENLSEFVLVIELGDQ